MRRSIAWSLRTHAEVGTARILRCFSAAMPATEWTRLSSRGCRANSLNTGWIAPTSSFDISNKAPSRSSTDCKAPASPSMVATALAGIWSRSASSALI